jgi:hypothetical protein
MIGIIGLVLLASTDYRSASRSRAVEMRRHGRLDTTWGAD